MPPTKRHIETTNTPSKQVKVDDSIKDAPTSLLKPEEAATKANVALERIINVCDRLKQCLVSIAKAKEEGDEAKLNTCIVDGAVLMMELRKEHRDAHWNAHIVQSAPSVVDDVNLTLQNLLYEKEVFQKEIARCSTKSSSMDAIDLAPMKEFLDQAPEEMLTMAKEGGEHQHQIQLDRLSYELRCREALVKQLREIEEEKEERQNHVEEIRGNLLGLRGQLGPIQKAVAPLGKVLGIQEVEKNTKLQERAQLLPHALYVLFQASYAHAQAFEKENAMIVEISGNLREAKETVVQEAQPMALSDDEEEDSTMYTSHPLAIEWVLNVTAPIKIRFEWLPQLECVTAAAYREGRRPSSRLLVNLWPGDAGAVMPNQAKNMLFSPKHTARPFLWAQRLAGRTCFAPCSSYAKNNGLSLDASVESVVGLIKARLLGKDALRKQVKELKSGVVPESKLDDALPFRAQVQMDSWDSTTSKAFAATLTTWGRKRGEDGAPSSTCHHFQAKFVREDERMVVAALVEVDPGYPLVPPHFWLKLDTIPKSMHPPFPEWLRAEADPAALEMADQPAMQHNHLAEIEAELDAHYLDVSEEGRTMVGYSKSTAPSAMLLSEQVSRLRLCLDLLGKVYEEGGAHAVEHGKTKLGRAVVRWARGRGRKLPFRIDPDTGLLDQR